MDPLAIGIIAVVIAGITWVVFFSGKDEAPSNPEPVKAKPVGKPVVPQKSVKTLPGDAALKSLTKASLEELGRDMGVELDKRKTKANMIADLKSRVK